MTTPPFRILALDGGGIRGCVTAVWLGELERQIKRPLRECFDLIAGTSTGAILAGAIGAGLEPVAIEELYVERGRSVFPAPPARWLSRLRRLLSQGPSAPRYDGLGLEAELRRVLGDTTLGELRPAVIMPAYNTENQRTVLLRNWEHQHVPAWQAAKASSSAPTYFPATLVRLNGSPAPLIDGGVWANNPAAEALHAARALWGQEPREVLMASFGTGQITRPIRARQALEWGLAEWAPLLIPVCFDGQAESVDRTVRGHVPRYWRFQMDLPAGYEAMDEPGNAETLAHLARGHLMDQDVARAMGELARALGG